MENRQELERKIEKLFDVEYGNKFENSSVFDLNSQQTCIAPCLMTEKEFDKLVNKINKYSIDRKNYSIYTWCDNSSYDYYCEYTEGFSIYITLEVKNIFRPFTPKEIEAIKSHLDNTFYEFDIYDNYDSNAIEQYEREKEEKERELEEKERLEKLEVFKQIGA